MVTIPNAKFTDSCVENVSAEPGRKLIVTLELTYETTPAQVREAMTTLRDIVAAVDATEDDPVIGFSGFVDFSMNLLLVYWIKSSEDNTAVQTDVNLQILERFTAAGLDMALPTQMVHTKAA